MTDDTRCFEKVPKAYVFAGVSTTVGIQGTPRRGFLGATLPKSALSIRAHGAAVHACQQILLMHEAWLDQNDHRKRYG